MIPKVANHILHHTTRAVAAVQNQTGHTIRNVLQSSPSNTTGGIGSWNGAGSSSSSWGSTGAGPGGAKYHAGSKFYSGYTGPGRALTQANSTSNETNSGQDDSDESTPKRARASLRDVGRSTRQRSSSLSLGVRGRDERGEKMGVLKTVQMHARARHAFARTEVAEQESECADACLLTGSSAAHVQPSSYSSRPVMVRRNSTSATSSDSRPLDIPPSPVTTAPLPPTDPAAPQSTTPPKIHDDGESKVLPEKAALLAALRAAGESGDANRAFQEVMSMRRTFPNPDVKSYNAAIQALHETRQPGQPLNFMLETYNEMLQRSLMPNFRTYTLLIGALTERDHEVHKVLTTLETRMKRRVLTGRQEVASHSADEARATELRAENNFGSAMALFKAASSFSWSKMTLPTYANLLRSCAYHANVDAAIQVFGHLEGRTDILPTASIYSHLIMAYMNAGDFEGCKVVFGEFKQASLAGRVGYSVNDTQQQQQQQDTGVVDDSRTDGARSAQLHVWNKMIEAHFRAGQPSAALGILEQMMDTQAGESFGPADVPPPASSTFTVVIAGFCRSGDVKTALAWFDRLLQQESGPRHPYESSVVPTRPDFVSWITMLDNLVQARMVDDLNRLFSVLLTIAPRDSIQVRVVDRMMVLDANLELLQSDPPIEKERALVILQFLLKSVIANEAGLSSGPNADYWNRLIGQCLRYGSPNMALDSLEQWISAEMERIKEDERSGEMSSEMVLFRMKGLRNSISTITPALLGQTEGITPVPFTQVLRLGHVSALAGMAPGQQVAAYYLYVYEQAKLNEEAMDQLSVKDWELLQHAATSLARAGFNGERDYPRPSGFTFSGLVPFLEDLAKHGVDPLQFNRPVLLRVIQVISREHGPVEAKKILKRLGPNFAALTDPRPNQERNTDLPDLLAMSEDEKSITSFEDQTSNTESPTPSPKGSVHVDLYHSRFVEEFFPTHPTVTPLIAYERFKAGIPKGFYPSPETMGRLINALGRLGEMEKVHELYEGAQRVLSSIDYDKRWQSTGWFFVEDQMIVAFAHSGRLEEAHLHRQRIIEQGGSPSADAYGALIQAVKDTTDDTVYTMELFDESRLRGVRANVFLYNIVISKLAKARKADYALELFQQMKAEGLRPSSITYGAIIAACCRVGDSHSAELLFDEMINQANFKPRVPPYNTMIQLYTQTKPNRERALYYYEALLKKGVRPTDHTYKLLLDAYGTIEPVNTTAMDEIFQRLLHDKSVKVQGTHWASLLNAWGCVKKDLDKAQSIFDSIATHPSTIASKSAYPDVIAYEAMINVLVTHRRADLISVYLDRLTSSGIHMTAYIANLLIKGYAAVGDLTRARATFEGLADPPQGVAAPNNHAPHNAAQSVVPADAPVYREPSTWEAMVRAELANGNRDQAVILLERMQARQFPPAVVQRISGIMLDESVSPWSSDSIPSPNRI